jgi:hypothetical protein
MSASSGRRAALDRRLDEEARGALDAGVVIEAALANQVVFR